MRPRTLLLPAAALVPAALVLAPRPAPAFELLGGALRLGQRDVRVFDNFSDAEAHSNQTPHRSFPGAVGPQLAIWKAAVEWGSGLHGDGQGDPTQPADLGSGGANFDFVWQGDADSVGGTNDNVVSEINGGAGGVLAFTELPIQDGWRIRFYSSPWTWHDDPAAASIGGLDRDLQAVATHELGHALGLDHTSVPGATMTAVTQQPDTPLRSIEADDAQGLAYLYGQKAPDKPEIASYRLVGGGQVEILGQNFGAWNEVWFTRGTPGGDGTPVKVRGVSATPDGRAITVAIPLAAGPGDVLVRRAGNAFSDLSNAFPFDPTQNPCPANLAYGTGTNTLFGQARLFWSGQPSLTTQDFAFQMLGMPASQTGLMIWSTAPTDLPFLGGSLLVAPPVHRGPAFTTDFVGFASLPFAVPASLVDETIYWQAWFPNPFSPAGAGVSNGLRISFCP